MIGSSTEPERRPDRVLGGPHTTFWQHCERDEFWMQRCSACSTVLWPPEPEACEHCGGLDLPFVPLLGTGRIISWCTFERRYYTELSVPWPTIVVELDEGPLFIANPHGFTPSGDIIGRRVRVRYLAVEDGAGPFRLPVFAVIGDEPDRHSEEGSTT